MAGTSPVGVTSLKPLTSPVTSPCDHPLWFPALQMRVFDERMSIPGAKVSWFRDRDIHVLLAECVKTVAALTLVGINVPKLVADGRTLAAGGTAVAGGLVAVASAAGAFFAWELRGGSPRSSSSRSPHRSESAPRTRPTPRPRSVRALTR